MTTFSKQFSEKAKNLTCKDFFHPDFESCLSFLWFIHSGSVIRGLKYMGPIFLLPLIIKIRKTSFDDWKDDWKESAVTYLKMVFGMSFVVSSGLTVHCCLNKIYKEIRYFNVCAIPAFIGILLSVNFFPPKFVDVQFLFINNLLVQTIFRNSGYKIFRIVRESRMFSTTLFMLLSSLIMGLMSLTRGEKHRYWYAQNERMVGENQKNEVEKKVLLKEVIKKQLSSTMKVGFLMSSIKILSNSVKLLRKNIAEFTISSIQNFDYKLLAFFFIYGTSFQITNFLLNQNEETNQHRNSFLAGFLAGTAFYLSPRYFLFTYGFTAFIELLLLINLKQLDPKSKITKFLKNLPWRKIFFCISLPTFVHWRIFYPWMIPKFIDELIKVVTSDRLAYGAQIYAKHILEI